MMLTKIKCLICGNEFKSISNTHLKTHNITEAEYKSKFPGCTLRSENYSNLRRLKFKNKTYEEIYGSAKAIELKNKRRESATKQMTDPKQISIRKEKCGAPEHYTLQRKLNMSSAVTDEVKLKRKLTTIKNIESGKFNHKIYGRQSNVARSFILNYLRDNNILDSNCYYDGGGINNKEYYQVVYDTIKSRYRTICYDLVITKDGKHNIECIVEINGPWHYRLDEVLLDPQGKSCPLKTNKYSKLESYNLDCLKLNHALDLCESVYVYWLDTNDLVKINKKLNIIEINT